MKRKRDTEDGVRGASVSNGRHAEQQVKTRGSSRDDGNKKGSLKAVRNGGKSGGNGSKKKDQIPAFLTKTYEIMGDPNTQDIASWSKSGTCIIVKDADRFAAEILPAYFKHNNFTSFVRQLNMYGFHKTKQDANLREFNHPMFQRGQPEKLVHIKRNRKKETYKSVQQRQKEKEKALQEKQAKAMNSSNRHSKAGTGRNIGGYGMGNQYPALPSGLSHSIGGSQKNVALANAVTGGANPKNANFSRDVNYAILRQDVNILCEGHDHVCHTINDLWMRVKKLSNNERLLAEHVLLLRHQLSASITLQSNLLTAVQNLSTCFALGTDSNSQSGQMMNLNEESGRVEQDREAQSSRSAHVLEEQRQLLVTNSYVLGEVSNSIKLMYEALRTSAPNSLISGIAGDDRLSGENGILGKAPAGLTRGGVAGGAKANGANIGSMSVNLAMLGGMRNNSTGDKHNNGGGLPGGITANRGGQKVGGAAGNKGAPNVHSEQNNKRPRGILNGKNTHFSPAFFPTRGAPGGGRGPAKNALRGNTANSVNSSNSANAALKNASEEAISTVNAGGPSSSNPLIMDGNGTVALSSVKSALSGTLSAQFHRNDLKSSSFPGLPTNNQSMSWGVLAGGSRGVPNTMSSLQPQIHSLHNIGSLSNLAAQSYPAPSDGTSVHHIAQGSLSNAQFANPGSFGLTNNRQKSQSNQMKSNGNAKSIHTANDLMSRSGSWSLRQQAPHHPHSSAVISHLLPKKMNPNAITGMKNAQQADKVNTPRGHHIKVTEHKESPAQIRKKDTMLLGKPSFAMDLPTRIAPRNR